MKAIDHIARLSIACLLTATVVLAQGPTFTITPDHAPAGVARQITVQAPSTGAITIMRPTCLWLSVESGGPNGTPVLQSPMCFPSPTTLPPCGTLSQNWTPPSLLQAGTYWMRCDATDAQTGQVITRFVDFRVDGSPAPTLSAPNPPLKGQLWTLALAHPTDPTAGYFAAASLTTDSGIPFGSDHISLDPDILFSLALPSPHPGLFVNFLGGLDLSGNATMAMFIPNIPFLDCVGVHVQALMFSPTHPTVLSNCVDAVIM